MRGLDNRVALVTGGASGIGAAIARRLAQEGARVIISDLRSDCGEEVAKAHGFSFLQQDVCDETRWAEVISEVEGAAGRLDILINNAGIVDPAGETTPETTSLINLRRIFAVNVEGTLLGSRAAIRAMRRVGRGSIVNISSVAGLVATPYATAYGASKAAVYQLTRSFAQHCIQEGLAIRCNSVHPGNVRTPLWDRQAEQTARARGVPVSVVIEEGRSEIPMGEFTRPEDVAAAVCFLASDDARYITAESLVVDGGIKGCDTLHIAPQRVAMRPLEHGDTDATFSGSFNHIGISVSNLESSLHFYRDLLNMRVIVEEEFSGAHYDQILGLDRSKGRVALVKSGNLSLEIFEFYHPTPRQSDPNRPVSDHGITHFCIEVTDIGRVYERLKAAGVQFHCPPLDYGGKEKATYGRDPDGNVFELLQIVAPLS